MPRTRTFIALKLGDEVERQLLALQRSLDPVAADVKWVERDNLHLTLLFLGEVDDRELVAVCRATQAAVADLPAFTLQAHGVGSFPTPRRPRILWAGIGAGAPEVIAVHDAVEMALLELGCYRREERQYTPHITLGRRPTEAPADALAQALAKCQNWTAAESAIDAVHVMASELTSHGPRYSVLSRARLGEHVVPL